MQKLTKSRLQDILTRKLALRAPEFRLEKWGPRLGGSIISDSFKGKQDTERQFLIWDALESELGADASRLVGMLLAYTPGEWTMGEDLTRVRLRKKAG
ncbi:MAG TPA: hypothetical protein VKX17_23605 [Planctomycetota bacterium]|nr:hypothetical protein [Planctomycetota bacterium]